MDKLRMLEFYSKEVHSSGERKLVGVVQYGDSGMVEDCFDTIKPTYYFDADGKAVDYIGHAQFIAKHSFQSYDALGSWWVYPMLRFEDKGSYNAVTLFITHYERKPFHLPAEAK